VGRPPTRDHVIGASRRCNTSTTRKGEPIILSEWALHIQCTWRIVGALGIVVGLGDLYKPAVGDPDLDPDDYDYEGPVPNRRDVRLATLFEARQSSPLMVASCTADEVGGFRLMLSDGFRLEVFPCDSDESPENEHWRLFRFKGAANDHWQGFRPPSKAHFVVTGSGVVWG